MKNKSLRRRKVCVVLLLAFSTLLLFIQIINLFFYGGEGSPTSSTFAYVSFYLFLLQILLAISLIIVGVILALSQKDLQLDHDRVRQGNELAASYIDILGLEIKNLVDSLLQRLGGLRDAPLTTDQRRNLVAIEQSALSAQDVVTTIVHMNNPKDTVEVENARVIRLQDCIDRCVNIVRYSKPEAVRLESHIESSVGEHFFCDPMLLAQILLNLLGNAVKFSQEGLVELRVMAEHQRDDFYLVSFIVNDEGVGIEAKVLPFIFEAYHHSSDQLQGTGLGLSFVKSAVSAMGGTISAGSERGVGSQFIAEIPLRLASPNEAAELAPSLEEPLSAGSVSFAGSIASPKVLVAEDNDINQMVATRMLEKLGCEVSLAHDGAEAVTMAQQGNFDLILMDLQMPKKNGLEATRELLASMQHVPHIAAMTANVLEGEKRRCREAGMVDFIAKPVKMATLEACLKSLKLL